MGRTTDKIRTLVRADRLTLSLVVPAWGHDIMLPINERKDVPEAVIAGIKMGQTYFHARVNIGAELPSQIEFESWELE